MLCTIQSEPNADCIARAKGEVLLQSDFDLERRPSDSLYVLLPRPWIFVVMRIRIVVYGTGSITRDNLESSSFESCRSSGRCLLDAETLKIDKCFFSSTSWIGKD